MTKMDEFVKLAATRDALEVTQDLLAQQSTSINNRLEELSLELTAGLEVDIDEKVVVEPEEEFVQEEDFTEEFYPHMADLYPVEVGIPVDLM